MFLYKPDNYCVVFLSCHAEFQPNSAINLQPDWSKIPGRVTITANGLKINILNGVGIIGRPIWALAGYVFGGTSGRSNLPYL
jgi:hypothetical protein